MNSIVRREPGPKRVAFTGYRPAKMPFGYDESDPLCVDLKRRLHDMIECFILSGYTHFISGAAMGFDMYAAEAVLDLQATYPQATLELAIPYEGQAEKWSPEYHQRWSNLIAHADMVTVVSQTYTKNCFFVRNRYLVHQADVLLACYDPVYCNQGGTRMTVDYATETGMCRVVMIPPVKDSSSERRTA